MIRGSHMSRVPTPRFRQQCKLLTFKGCWILIYFLYQIFSMYNGDFNHILSDLKMFDLDHQLQVQLSSLMWDYDHDTPPTSLKPHFKRVNLVHSYSTRSVIKGNFYYSKVYTSKYGIKSLSTKALKYSTI